MTEFSKYLSRVVKRRGLKCVQVAEMCSMDTSVVFRWLNGRVLPKSWERLEPVMEKLRLTQDEISGLKAAYRREVLGDSQSRRFDEIMETMQMLKAIQKSHHTYMQNTSWMHETGFGDADSREWECLEIESREDVWQCIQNVLLAVSFRKDRNLCLKMHDFSEMMRMQLKQFCCGMVDDGRLDILICQDSQADDIRFQKLKQLKEMADLLFYARTGSVFCYSMWDVEESIQQNWMVSDSFFLQFSDDMSRGMLTWDAQWISFFRESFDEMKKGCEPLFKRDTRLSEYMKNKKYMENENQTGGISIMRRSGSSSFLCLRILREGERGEEDVMEEIVVADNDILQEYRSFLQYLPQSR